jgi:hypothetical protein
MGKPRMLGAISKPIKNKERKPNPFGKRKKGKS